MNTINERIAKVFEESNLTQTKFAERIKLSQTTVSKVITGTQKPSDRAIIDIADAFDVNEDWLRTGEGPMRPDRSHSEELARFFSEVMKEDIPYRREIIAALSRMNSDGWKMVGEVILDAAEKIREAEKKEPASDA